MPAIQKSAPPDSMAQASAFGSKTEPRPIPIHHSHRRRRRPMRRAQQTATLQGLGPVAFLFPQTRRITPKRPLANTRQLRRLRLRRTTLRPHRIHFLETTSVSAPHSVSQRPYSRQIAAKNDHCTTGQSICSESGQFICSLQFSTVLYTPIDSAPRVRHTVAQMEPPSSAALGTRCESVAVPATVNREFSA